MKSLGKAAAASRIYWNLWQRYDDGNWGIEFGSWDRGEVVAERQSLRDSGVRAKDIRIDRGGIRTTTPAATQPGDAS